MLQIHLSIDADIIIAILTDIPHFVPFRGECAAGCAYW